MFDLVVARTETEVNTTILVFVRSTDGKVYLDGKLTDVTVLP